MLFRAYRAYESSFILRENSLRGRFIKDPLVAPLLIFRLLTQFVILCWNEALQFAKSGSYFAVRARKGATRAKDLRNAFVPEIA